MVATCAAALNSTLRGPTLPPQLHWFMGKLVGQRVRQLACPRLRGMETSTANMGRARVRTLRPKTNHPRARNFSIHFQQRAGTPGTAATPSTPSFTHLPDGSYGG